MSFGRLTKVSPAEFNAGEAGGLTNWLAEPDNLSGLAQELGLTLQLEGVNQKIGPYRASLICRDTWNDRLVLIETQLERSDNARLGQLVTAAAGLEAATLVWLAAPVADEHRAAMDWINAISRPDIRAYALEIEFWRIGDSAPAPRYELVAAPAEQERAARQSGSAEGLSPSRKLQLEYWTEMESRIAGSGGPLHPVPATPASFMAHSLGKKGIELCLATNAEERWVRCEIYLSGESAETDFKKLSHARDAIEETLAARVDWQARQGKPDKRICLAMAADPTNREDWPRQQDWLLRTAAKMHTVFRPLVAQL